MTVALDKRATVIAFRRVYRKEVKPMSVDPVSVILLTLGAIALAALKAAITVLVLATPSRNER